MDSLQKLCDRTEKDTSSRSVIMKLLISIIGERDYSAQEVAHVLMGWPLYRCSRSFMNVYINDENWEKLEVKLY